MPELKKVWLFHDSPRRSNPFDPDFWGNGKIPDEDTMLHQYCDPEGDSISRLCRIYAGTDTGDWESENTKVYSDKASALKDARARMERDRKRYKSSKQASVVVARFLEGL